MLAASDAGLFHLTLSDGRTFDEAVTTEDFISNDSRNVYDLIYHQLADSKAPGMTLAWLLAELASNDQQELANLATLAESEVDLATQGGPELKAQLMRSAVDCLLSFHREEEYQQARQSLVDDVRRSESGDANGSSGGSGASGASGGSGASEASSGAASLQDQENDRIRRVGQLLQHRRANPSPARIARMNT